MNDINPIGRYCTFYDNALITPHLSLPASSDQYSNLSSSVQNVSVETLVDKELNGGELIFEFHLYGSDGDSYYQFMNTFFSELVKFNSAECPCVAMGFDSMSPQQVHFLGLAMASHKQHVDSTCNLVSVKFDYQKSAPYNMNRG